MKTVNPKEVSVGAFHSYLLGAVAPRPIAFASTVDKKGNVNLSPFSFFNCFSANPPILVFSPSRRARDNTTKHSLENILEHPEVVINIVNYAIVEQTSLASTEYAKGVNEFVKAGLTELASEMVKPPRVAESPITFECKVNQVIPLGNENGAGNLVICEVLLAHFKEKILNEKGSIDPYKLDSVARMGADWYCRVNGEAIFQIAKPLTSIGIGIDQIPEKVRLSTVLTGNDLGKLGNVETLPLASEIEEFEKEPAIIELFRKFEPDKTQLNLALHHLAKDFLAKGEIQKAWKTLLLI